ncbi:MAG: hypothetical protein GY793_04920 [Proteobacteria bacterium]|nr:hypothetical protein [Pseudomonadota bacterium]
MTELQKFLFETNYSTDPENVRRIQKEKLSEARNLLHEECEQIKQQAFQQGFADGQKQALEKLEQELTLHVDNIVNNLTELEGYKKDLHKLFEDQSILTVKHLVNSVIFKSEELFPDKILQQSINNSLENLPFSTKIVIKVPTEGKRYLQDIGLDRKLKDRGITDFAVLEEPALSAGESSISWDESSILSSKKESLDKINFALNAFLNKEDVGLSEQIDISADTPTTPIEETVEEAIEEKTEAPEVEALSETKQTEKLGNNDTSS